MIPESDSIHKVKGAITPLQWIRLYRMIYIISRRIGGPRKEEMKTTGRPAPAACAITAMTVPAIM